jgi:hypothetical protein
MRILRRRKLMTNNIPTKYKLISKNDLTNIGEVKIFENSLSVRVQKEYDGAVKFIIEDIIQRGEFDQIIILDTSEAGIEIENISELFVKAFKEECLLRLELVLV